MATVATGIPRGIWTIESSESRPPRCWVGIGTPMTGRVVFAASIPGRCAAPPAPGDDHPDPAPGAPSRRSGTGGRACGARDTTRSSLGTPSSSSTASACSSTGKSERLPPTMPTTGRAPPASAHVVSPPSAAPRARRGPARAPRRHPCRRPSRGPSCAARRPAACRTRGGGRPGRRAHRPPRPRRASRSAPVPRRLTIAVTPCGATDPSGSPRIARSLLLELGRRRALDRPVAAVVHPRRELVDHQPAAAQLEQLDGQHARRGRGGGRRCSAISAAS